MYRWGTLQRAEISACIRCPQNVHSNTNIKKAVNIGWNSIVESAAIGSEDFFGYVLIYREYPVWSLCPVACWAATTWLN